MPWEKEIYVTMLIDFLREEEKRMKDQQAAQQASGEPKNRPLQIS